MLSGELQGRFAFLAVTSEEGELGAKRSAPVEQFTLWGALRPLNGGETVMASRLQSRQPAILSIRQTARTRTITTDWQARDSSGKLYNIRTVTDPDMRRRTFDLLVESGVAA